MLKTLGNKRQLRSKNFKSKNKEKLNGSLNHNANNALKSDSKASYAEKVKR